MLPSPGSALTLPPNLDDPRAFNPAEPEQKSAYDVSSGDTFSTEHYSYAMQNITGGWPGWRPGVPPERVVFDESPVVCLGFVDPHPGAHTRCKALMMALKGGGMCCLACLAGWVGGLWLCARGWGLGFK